MLPTAEQQQGSSVVKQIKVAHVIEATTGGTKKHILYLATRMSRKQFDVTLICSIRRDKRFRGEVQSLQSHGVNVEIIDMRREISPWADMKAFFGLLRCMRRGAFDVVHTHSSKAGFLGRFAARMAGVDVILYSPHCFYFQQKRGLPRFFYFQLERLAALVTDCIVTVSHGESDLARTNGIIGHRKLTTVVNALDCDELLGPSNTRRIKNCMGIHECARVVGTVSRFARQKGFKHFFEAGALVLQHLPDVVLVFVGGGRDRAAAEALIGELGIGDRVVLTGELHDVAGALSVMDVFCLTSLYEGMPYAMLEAMALSKPIVASRIPGIAEVLDGWGTLVDPGNHSGFASAIIELLCDPERAKRAGQRGRRVLERNHQVAHQIEALSVLYERLLAEKRAGRRRHEKPKSSGARSHASEGQ